MPQTRLLQADDAGISVAAEILRNGGLVAFPTETVYGLGAIATSDQAVARVYEAKGRPSFNPLIAHVSSLEVARQYVDFNEPAERLATAFWPGPLTLVLPLKDPPAADVGENRLSKLVTAGGNFLAVRIPANPVARALLESVGQPVAAPSANPSGRISPTRSDHVLAGLNGKIDAILDAGPCDVGVESTIIGLDGAPHLLRAGGVTTEAIEEALGAPLSSPPSLQTPTAPGQLASHYAPTASVRLNAREAQPGEFLIGFAKVEGDMTLSATGDLLEAAARLFDVLHQADASGAPIAVAPIPEHGLGRAINDRLRRAAAPRDKT